MYLVANDMQVDDKDKGKDSKQIRRRQEDSQFNFENTGEIPIQVTNGESNRKYWVEVPERKSTERLSSEGNGQKGGSKIVGDQRE